MPPYYRASRATHSAGQVASERADIDCDILLALPFAFLFGPTSPPSNVVEEPARTRKGREFVLQVLSFDLYPHYSNPLKRFSPSVGVLRLFTDSRGLGDACQALSLFNKNPVTCWYL